MKPFNNPDVEVLRTGEYIYGKGAWPYKLLKLTSNGNQPTYAQWFPPPGETPGPVVVYANPYVGCDWSDEEVDLRWRDREYDYYPDEECPSNKKSDSLIVYATQSPDQVGDETISYLFHDYGVLVVFGRFYTGRNIQDNVDDMITGLHFIANEPMVDKKSIGIFGLSWGGFEALYAAAHAPEGAIPAAGIGIAPISDFEVQVNYLLKDVPGKATKEVRQIYEAFFEPYLRRIFAVTGGPPDSPEADFSNWNAQALAKKLKSPFLVIHDNSDTLVPIESSRKLVMKSKGMVEGVWFTQENLPHFNDLPLCHGLQLEASSSRLIHYTFILSYLLTRIGRPSQQLVVTCHPEGMREYLSGIQNLQKKGADISWLAPRLLDLTDPRITILDAAREKMTCSGAEYVADELNALWKTSVDKTSVADFLKEGIPPIHE